MKLNMDLLWGVFHSYLFSFRGWFTQATESEAQGTLRSSVNQKEESEAESEARRNRSQKDQKSFFFFLFHRRRFRSSENKVNGIGSGSRIISQSKNSLPAISRHLPGPPSWMFTNESEAYTESKAYVFAFVAPIHTRSELSSDSDSASVASVASVNQPLNCDSVGQWNATVLGR